jgi:hypothetical protein
MFTVSEIVFTVSEIIRPVSVIYVTYPGVGSLRGDPVGYGRLRASCHAPVSLSAVQGVSGAGSHRGDPHNWNFYTNYEFSTRAGRHGDPGSLRGDPRPFLPVVTP